jgi:hypothetical protein
MGYLDNAEVLVRLEDLAITGYERYPGDTSTHDVVVYRDLRDRDMFDGEPVLRVDGTPGGWYLATLLEKGVENQPQTMYIDYGQGWVLWNYREVLNAALQGLFKAMRY